MRSLTVVNKTFLSTSMLYATWSQDKQRGSSVKISPIVPSSDASDKRPKTSGTE